MLFSRKPKALGSADLYSHSGPLRATYPVEHSKEQSQEIKFYDRKDPYYEFTNFYPCHVVIDGKTWPSTEHYFQAQKFVGTPYVEAIRRFPTAREAFQLSRTPQASRWCRGDWERVKEDIMLKALRCKFNDNPELKKKLLATGNKRLIEHTHNDSYWADGGDGSGKNKLGKLLERVRSELQSPPRDARDLDLESLTISKSKAEMVPMDSSSPHQSLLKRSNSFSGSTRHKTTAQRMSEWSHYSLTSSSTAGSEQVVTRTEPSHDTIDVTRHDLKSNDPFLSHEHRHDRFTVDSPYLTNSLLGTGFLANAANQQPSVPADGVSKSSLKKSHSFSSHYAHSSTVEPSNSVQCVLVSRENLLTEKPKNVSLTQRHVSSKGDYMTTYRPLHANTSSMAVVPRTYSYVGAENQRPEFPNDAPSHSSSLRRSSSTSRLHGNTSSRMPESSNPLQANHPSPVIKKVQDKSKYVGAENQRPGFPNDAPSHPSYLRRSSSTSRLHSNTSSRMPESSNPLQGHLEKSEHSCGSENPSPQIPKDHQSSSLRSDSIFSLISANHPSPVIKRVQDKSKDHSSHSSFSSKIKWTQPSLPERKKTDMNHSDFNILTWVKKKWH
eukprot:Em0001g2186a